jgi:chromosome segregation ATPase
MGIKDEALSTAAEAVASGDEDAKEHARNLITAFERWETTREYGKKERKRCNDNVSARLAALKEAMEVGHSTDEQQLLKLGVVEQRWQDLEDARTERKEVAGAMKDQMKLCETRIKELIEALRPSQQLGLFNSTIDNPPTPEEEEEDDSDDDIPE